MPGLIAQSVAYCMKVMCFRFSSGLLVLKTGKGIIICINSLPNKSLACLDYKGIDNIAGKGEKIGY